MQEIHPGDIANLELDTRVLLTRYRGEQIHESSIRAVEIVDSYYSQIPEVQMRLRIHGAPDHACGSD